MTLALLIVLTIGLVVGAIAGWLGARNNQTRLQREVDRVQHELEKDRAVHAERLKSYQDAETKFRDAFSTLSTEALKSNTEQFLSLAQSKLQQARTEANADIESRRKSIEDLLAPIK